MIACLENVHKAFAGGFLMRRRAVLRGLDLGIEEGDSYGLLGDNGAGKSTSLRILLGLSRPDRGSGSVLGKPLGDRVALGGVGYLPESPTFHESLTALELLRLSGSLLGMRGPELRRRTLEWLDRVELGHVRDVRLRKMSKGMLQRLGLAQALLGDPRLLILDEPMSGLDPLGRKMVRDLILEQRRAGRTVLFSTHILADVELVCTRAGVLRGGVLACELRLRDLASLGAHSIEVQASGLGPAAVSRFAALARSHVQSGSCVLFTVAPGTPARELVQGVLAAGGELQAVTPRRPSLEEIFVAATHDARPSAAPAAPVTPPRGREPVPSGKER